MKGKYRIRELSALLLKAGCQCRPGKGSHLVFFSAAKNVFVVLSGKENDEAKHYQERRVFAFLNSK